MAAGSRSAHRSAAPPAKNTGPMISFRRIVCYNEPHTYKPGRSNTCGKSSADSGGSRRIYSRASTIRLASASFGDGYKHDTLSAPPAGYGIHSRHPALYAASGGRYFAVLPRGQQDADSPPNLPPVPGRFRSGQRRRTDLDGACTAHPDVRNCHANQSGRRKAIFCQSFGPADTPQTLEMAAAGPALPVSMGCRYPKEACRYIAVGLSPGRCATARLLMLWTSQA